MLLWRASLSLLVTSGGGGCALNGAMHEWFDPIGWVVLPTLWQIGFWGMGWLYVGVVVGVHEGLMLAGWLLVLPV